MTRLRVGILHGGRSGEHEVSVASAASVCAHLDPQRYEIVPLHIARDGRWTRPAQPPTATSAADVLDAGGAATPIGSVPVDPVTAVAALDVVFPVLHGPYGEDGTVQGLLEMAGVAYVGAGVLGSAVGMDKAVMKTLFAAAGLPIVPWVTVRRHEWAREAAALTARVGETLGYPVFVKPANLGSSVGISRVASPGALCDAVALALEFDAKVVVEAAVPHAREIECAVLGNDDAEASVPGEIVPSGEFYDYQAKYLDSGSQLLIPAPLDEARTARVRRLALDAFRAVEGAGLARVDFLLARDSGTLVVNEVNTLPGFTTISMYPKLWEASGLSYPHLLDRLVALALARHRTRQQLRTTAIRHS